MKNKLNPHNQFNNDSYSVRRWKFIMSKDLLDKGEQPIPLLKSGKISPLFNENIPITEKNLKKWFFKFGLDVGLKINGRMCHIMPNKKFNENFGHILTRFRIYEVKNELT